MNVDSTDTIDIETLAAVIRDELALEDTAAHEADADISKANALLGCEPSRDIREGRV